jgi:hypothetical protein
MRRADGQWRKAALAWACVLRPRGTGLGVGSVSRPVGTQCSRSAASDRRSQARSDVRARRYGGEADVACRGATSRVGSLISESFQSGLVWDEFAPKFKTKLHKSLNTKLLHHTTLYKTPNALGGLDQRIWHKKQIKLVEFSAPGNNRSRHWLAFCTLLHSKSAMPPDMKIVCLDKLHNFPIGRFWSV